ncbi:MAG: zinc ribbon domain-containing protein [Anaerolineae bacterium]
MSTVADLWNLQSTDLAIEAVRHRLAELERLLGETPALLAARQQVAEREVELADWRSRQQSLETQARELNQRIQAAERDLMSGRVRNPKELKGMQDNVASLKRRRAGLEDQILEAMLEIDRCREELASATAHGETVETAWQASQAALNAELTEKLAQLKDLAARLNQRWKDTDPADQELYRSLRSRKGGRAVALVERDTCQACGMSLPTSVRQRARDQRVFCPTCGRLLYARS